MAAMNATLEAGIDLVVHDDPPRHLKLGAQVLLGRAAHCDVVLRGWRVAAEHLRLVLSPMGIWLEDLGSVSGTQLQGRRVSRAGPIGAGEIITVGSHRLSVQPRAAVSMAPAVVASSDVLLSKPETPAIPIALQAELHRRLLQAIDLRQHDLSRLSPAALRDRLRPDVEQLIEQWPGGLPAGVDAEQLAQCTLDEAVGLGPLEPLLADESITEIMVNGPDDVWVEQAGRLRRVACQFSSAQSIRQVIDRIAGPLGRRIDEGCPMVDARLPDGSRLNAVIGPVSLRGPVITIRRFSRELPKLGALAEAGTLSAAMHTFLAHAVKQRLSVLISGGTGAGKTTLLNALAACIPHEERLITIEDAAELRFDHPHCLALEARPANAEGQGAITIRDLLRNALRMRPNRIIIGECRGAEALDLLGSMQTGHDGSLATLHANSPRDALSRLETLVLMAGLELPLAAIREQIASALDLVVQVARLPDGARRVVSIAEVGRVESGMIALQPLFEFDMVSGRHEAVGLPPQVQERWRAQGCALPASLFEVRRA